jgi:hypothetical protein
MFIDYGCFLALMNYLQWNPEQSQTMNINAFIHAVTSTEA